MLTIPQQFHETAMRFSSRTALKYKHGGVYVGIGFDELRQRVEAFAKGLRALGVKEHDRVAILGPNCPEWVIADLGAMSIGAISVPVHTTFSPSLISHVVSHSGCRALVVIGQPAWTKLLATAPSPATLQLLITADLKPSDTTASAGQTLKTFGEVVMLGKADTSVLNVLSQPEQTASIIYTSGTTGLPKGVMLTHRNLLFNAEGAVEAVPVDEHDRLLSFLPLSHVLERTAGYYAPLVCRGACIAYAESPKTLSENLREVRPTILVAVPRIFEKMHDTIWAKVNAGSPLKRRLFRAALRAKPGTFSHRVLDRIVMHKIRARVGGRLRLVISGGASLNPKLAKFFERVGLRIVEGYGLTETSPVITVNRLSSYAFGTVGQPLQGVEVKIAPDKEVLTRGPHVMAGYYEHPDATRDLIDADGWLHTGDLGFLDARGFLTIIGRKKEMLVTANGKNVWPEAIEFKLNDDRLISQTMVVGNGRKHVSALVVPYWPGVVEWAKEQGKPSDPRQLVKDPDVVQEFARRVDRVNADLADWEKMKTFRLLLDEFSQERDELTPTLKLRRKIVEEHYRAPIEEMYREG